MKKLLGWILLSPLITLAGYVLSGNLPILIGVTTLVLAVFGALILNGER